MITGELAGEKTLIHMGSHVQVGYYSQEQEWLSPDRTVIDEVRDLFNYGEAEARNVLGMFLFRGEDVFKKHLFFPAVKRRGCPCYVSF